MLNTSSPLRQAWCSMEETMLFHTVTFFARGCITEFFFRRLETESFIARLARPWFIYRIWRRSPGCGRTDGAVQMGNVAGGSPAIIIYSFETEEAASRSKTNYFISWFHIRTTVQSAGNGTYRNHARSRATILWPLHHAGDFSGLAPHFGRPRGRC